MEKKNIPQKIIGFIFMLIICVTIISCTSSPNLPIPSAPTNTPNIEIPGIVSGSFITYTSLAKMVSESSIIVIAQVINLTLEIRK